MRVRWRGIGSIRALRPAFNSSGQALTEFALVLPFLAVLFMGVLDLGRAFHTEVAASNAARVGLIYAQEVASPRMLDCNTTCQFITVGAIIATVKQEAQGGIDTSQAQVTVCLQHVASCPVTNMTEAVASDEAITITVLVPFQNITPFVHLSAVAGTVTGKTFPFEPVYPTDTPGPSPTATVTPTNTPTNTPPAGATATSTSTPTPTATPTNTSSPTSTPLPGSSYTPTPAPTSTSTSTATPTATPTLTIPNILTPGPSLATPAPLPSATPQSHTIAIRWTTDQPYSQNAVWVAPASNGDKAIAPGFSFYQASNGTSAFIQFSSLNGQGTYLPQGHYVYFVQSAADSSYSSARSTYSLTCAPSNCTGPMHTSTFTL